MRTSDWPEKLAEYLHQKRDVPFSWGTNDCASFACDAVFSMTGERLAIPVVETPEAYVQLLQDSGPLGDIVTSYLGEPIHPAFAQRGDVVLLQVEQRDTLGICVGESLAGPGLDGLVLIPMSLAVSAWRV